LTVVMPAPQATKMKSAEPTNSAAAGRASERSVSSSS
jgi:hypothetical protein